jgi:hypothetical protein
MKKTLTILTMMTQCLLLSAQSLDSILQNKYWVYKDRYLKFFTHTGGTDPGESLPMDVIVRGLKCGGVEGDRIQAGDVTANLGMYLVVLATEYELLSQSDDYEKLKACKNEMFYAIRAIDRLDRASEPFHNSQGGDFNKGYVIRDDVPMKYYKYWEETDNMAFHSSHSSNGFIPDSVIVTTNDSIVYPWNNMAWLPANDEWPMKATDNDTFQGAPFFGLRAYKWYESSKPLVQCGRVRDLAKTQQDPAKLKSNEMSQDQALGLLMGLRMIQLMVNSDSVYIQPTANDSGMWVMAETRLLAERLMSEVSRKHYDVEFDLPVRGDTSPWTPSFIRVKFDSASYIMINPVTGIPVDRGWEAFLMSGGYEKLGEDLTGKNYDAGFLAIKNYNAVYDSAWFKQFIANKVLKKTIKEFDGNMRDSANSQNFWRDSWNNLPSLIKSSGDSDGGSAFDVGMNMLMRLGAITGSWTHSDFRDLAEGNDYPWYELFYAVVNNKTPLLPKSYYQDILDSAHCTGVSKWPRHYVSHDSTPTGNCGAWVIDDDPTPPDTNYYYFGCEANWHPSQLASPIDTLYTYDTTWTYDHHPFNKSDIFSLPSRKYSSGAWVDGDFSGIDYLMLHNLFRLAFPTQSDQLAQGCPCESSVSEAISSVTYDTLKTIARFPEYRDIELRVPEYITHHITIGLNGVLYPKGDLTICKNLVRVTSNGKALVSGSDKTRPKELRINSGGILELRPGSTLQVDTFSKVIIEPGGTLKVFAGSEIVLDRGAVLEIRGNLEIMYNATFQITPGTYGQGLVRFKNNGENSSTARAKIIGQDFAKFVMKGPYPSYKIMEVLGSKPLVIPEKVRDSIYNGTVYFGNSSLNVYGRFFTEDAIYTALDSTASYPAAIITHGQNFVTINKTEFSYGVAGLVCGNFEGSYSPEVDQIECNHMEVGVWAQGGSMKIQGDFNYCGSGVELIKMNAGNRVHNSKFKHGGYGIFHDAQSTGPVKMVYDNVIDNIFGVYAMNGSVLIQCSTLDSNGDGLYLEHSPLISINENQKAGGNYFKNSSGNVVHGDNGAFVLDLANGHSQFKSNTNLFDGYLMNHSGLFKSGSNYYLSSSYNHWDVFPPYQYNLKYVISNVGKINAANVSLDHSDQYTSESALFTKQASLCPSYGTGSGSFAQKAAGSRYIDTDAQNITNSYYNGYTLGDVFEDINDRVYYDEDYNPGLQRTKSVFDAGLDTLSKFDEYVLGRLYRTMMECYGRIMYDDTSGIDHAGTTQELLYTLNNLIAKGNNPADTFWASQNVMITMDKAEVYRINDKRDTALLVLQDKLNYLSDADDIENINRFICIINSENAVINNQMGILDAQDYYDCYTEPDSSGTVAYFREPTNEVEDEKPVLEWAPQPNPAETGMEVKFNLKSTRFVSVEVYDLVGHKIDSKPRKRFKKGVNSMHFDVHDWPTGIYFVKLNYDDYSDTKRLVIQRN